MIPDGIVDELARRHGVSVHIERSAIHRATDLVVRFRPMTTFARVSLSDSMVESAQPVVLAEEVQHLIAKGAGRCRGETLTHVLANGPATISDMQGEYLLAGLLGAVASMGEGDEIELAADKLADLLSRHGGSTLCERVAIALMSRVEAMSK